MIEIPEKTTLQQLPSSLSLIHDYRARQLESNTRSLSSSYSCMAPCWITWVTALTWLAFDGVIFLAVQVALGAVLSAIATTASFVVGEYARTLIAAKATWRTLCLMLTIGSAAVLIDGKQLGLAHTYTDPNSHEPFVGLSQLAFIAGFFILNFAVANWPIRKPSQPLKTANW